MKRGRRNKMSGALSLPRFFFYFFFHRPMASQKMFPCVVSERAESKEEKHSLLQTTCNRFFLKPNKSAPCFRSCDTFCALCYSQRILFQAPTTTTGLPVPPQFSQFHPCPRLPQHRTFRVSTSCA